MSHEASEELNKSPSSIMKLRSHQCVSDSAVLGSKRISRQLNNTETLSTRFLHGIRRNGKLLKNPVTYSSAPQESRGIQCYEPELRMQNWAGSRKSRTLFLEEGCVQTEDEVNVNPYKAESIKSKTLLLEEGCVKTEDAANVNSCKGQLHISTKNEENSLGKSSSASVLRCFGTKTTPRCASMTSCTIKGQSKTEKENSCKNKPLKRFKTPGKVKNRNKTPRSKALGDWKIVSISVLPKHFNFYSSLIRNHSKMSEPARISSRKSYIGDTAPHQSQKQLSMILHSSWKKKSPDIKRLKKVKTSFSEISPASVSKTLSNEKRDLIPAGISPQKLSCRSVNIPNLLPRRCVGYENLFQTDSQSRCCECSEKIRTQNKHGTNKTKTSLIRAQHSANNRLGKQKISVKFPNKYCSEKHSLSELTNAKRNAKKAMTDNAHVSKRTLPIACSRMVPIKRVSYLSYPMEDIFNEGAVFVLHRKNLIKRTKKAKGKAKRVPHATTFSNGVIQDSKLKSNIKYMNYRQTGPLVRNCSNAFWANDSRFKLSFIKSATVPKHSNIKKRCFRAAPILSSQECIHLSPSKVHQRKCLNKHQRRRVPAQQPDVGIINTVTHKPTKNKLKCQTVKTTADTTRDVWIQTQELNTDVLKQHAPKTVYHYKNRKRKPIGTDSIHNVSLFSTELSSCEINKDISSLPKSESPFCTGLNGPYNAKNDRICWNKYKTTAESVSSFFTEISSWSQNKKDKGLCSDSSERERMGFVRGTITLPSAISCGRQKCNFRRNDIQDHAKKCVQLAEVTNNQSHSDRCSAALIPSLLRFLKCINQTLTDPLALKGDSPKTEETPMGNIQIQLSRNSVTSMRDLKSTTDNLMSKTMIKDNAKITQTCTIEKINAKENVHMSVKNNSDIMKPRLLTASFASQTEQNILWTTSCDSCKSMIKGVEPNIPKKKMENRIPFSKSPTSVAKSILRTGHIAPPISFQCETAKQQFKKMQRFMQEIYCECPDDQSGISAMYSVPYFESETDTRVLTFGLIVLTVIVQAILYFSVPSE